MTQTIYYCEIPGNYTREFSKGVTTIPWKREYTTKITQCIMYSDRVWVQGPRGGVKIVKNKRDMTNVYGYVTKNEQLMKEFMWVKLQAQSVPNYN